MLFMTSPLRLYMTLTIARVSLTKEGTIEKAYNTNQAGKQHKAK